MALSSSDKQFIQATIQNVVGDALKPVVHKLDNHHQTLYGPTEQNGLRGDMRGVKDWKQSIDVKWAKLSGMVIGGSMVATAIVNWLFK